MIEEGIVAAIKAADSRVTVHPSQVPENTTLPFVAYRQTDESDETVTFEIDSGAAPGLSVDSYRQSKILANAIRDKFKLGFTGPDDICVQETEVLKRSDHVDDVSKLHWVRAVYKFTLPTDPY